jgi:hypothetical protein
MILTAHHRSESLAARHLTALRRKYFRVNLISRRNANGTYSERGHTFVYEIEEKKPKKRIEVVLHFDYGTQKGHDLIRFQVHVFGPATATDAQFIRAVRQRSAGDPWPKGFSKKAIYWGQDEKRTDYISTKLRKAAIAGGSATVARKRAVRSNRRANRKAKK